MDALIDALGTLRHVTSGVRRSDFRRATPCEGLDVAGLLSHVVGWQQVFAAAALEERLPFDGSSPTYRAGAWVRRDLEQASAALVVALTDDAGPVRLPFRGLTARSVLVSELTAETVLHTWDLAHALRRPVAFDDAVVAAAEEGLRLLRAESFGPTAFAAAVDEPADDPLTRLVLRSGRRTSVAQ